MKAFVAHVLLLGLLALRVQAQLIDSYNADTLSPGSVTSWTDLTGTENATFANAISYLGYPGNPGVVAPTVSNAPSAFNGHNYVSFGYGNALGTADPLFSGTQSRTIVAVYATPLGDNGAVNPIAGETAAGTLGTWMELQARDAGVSGNPYLAGFAADTGSGTNPVANQLTFAVATYSITGGETLYYAYGNGSISSASDMVSLNTAAVPFEIGGESDTGPLYDMDIGTVQVYQSALTSTEATAEIQALQLYYSAPEPSTYALVLASLLGGLIFLKNRQRA